MTSTSPVLKILVVGDPATGKTSLIHRFVHNMFLGNYKTTIGVDFELKIFNVDGKTVRLQLWDVAGQERLGGISNVYCRDAVGALVVCDIKRPTTLKSIPIWKRDIDSKVTLPDGDALPMVLLANKIDLADQSQDELDETSVRSFAMEHNFHDSFVTSAKDNVNIDDAITTLVRKVLSHDLTSRRSKDNVLEASELSAGGSRRGGSESSGCC